MASVCLEQFIDSCRASISSRVEQACGACRTVEEDAAVEVSLCDQKKTTSLAEGRRAFKIYKAKKDGSESIVGGQGGDSGLEVIPPNFSSEAAAVFNSQTRLGGKVPAVLADGSDIALRRSELAASRLDEWKAEKNKAVDHALDFESEQVQLNAKFSN